MINWNDSISATLSNRWIDRNDLTLCNYGLIRISYRVIIAFGDMHNQRYRVRTTIGHQRSRWAEKSNYNIGGVNYKRDMLQQVSSEFDNQLHVVCVAYIERLQVQLNKCFSFI